MKKSLLSPASARDNGLGRRFQRHRRLLIEGSGRCIITIQTQAPNFTNCYRSALQNCTANGWNHRNSVFVLAIIDVMLASCNNHRFMVTVHSSIVQNNYILRTASAKRGKRSNRLAHHHVGCYAKRRADNWGHPIGSEGREGRLLWSCCNVWFGMCLGWFEMLFRNCDR